MWLQKGMLFRVNSLWITLPRLLADDLNKGGDGNLQWVTEEFPISYDVLHNSDDTWTSHYSDVIMSAMASLLTCISIVCSIVCLGADQGKHQSSASLAFVRGSHRWPVQSPHPRASNAENITIWWHHHGPCCHKSPTVQLLIKCLFNPTTNKQPKLRIAGLFRGIHRWPVDSTNKGQ